MADAPFFPAAASWLLTYGIHSTILLAGAWLLTGRWAVRSIVAHDAIWKVALVGGVFTASFQVAVGHEPYSGRFDIGGAVTTAPVAAPPSMGQQEPVRLPAEDGDHRMTAEAVVAMSPVAGPAMDQTAVSERALTGPRGPTSIDRVLALLSNIGWLGGLLSLWGIGALIGLARFGVARMRVARLLGDRREVQDPDLLNMLHTLRQVAGLRREIRLTWSATLTTPVAFRSEICLPKQVLTELSREHHRGILAHEVAHLARRDPTWIGVGMLVQRILFFQPLNALARRRMAETAEYLCDDWAVTYIGTKLTFAESLAAVATWISKAQGPALLSTMAEDGSQLVRRVERILDAHNSPTAWTHNRLRMPTAALALLAVGGAAPGVWYDLSDPDPPPLVEATPIVAVPIVATATPEQGDDQETPELGQQPTPKLGNEMPSMVEEPAPTPQSLTEETPVPSAPSQPLLRATKAAIKYLHKVMIIKDEIYVAHLLTSEEKLARDKKRYNVDESNGDKIKYVHLNRPHITFMGFDFERDISPRQWQLNLMKRMKFLRRWLPKWHTKEKAFRDWYIAEVIDTFAPTNAKSYENHVRALETPEEVRGYREVRYPKMAEARKEVEALLGK
ncbi:MAG: M48 family metalloprotease [Gemmatimonadetes bacterium]|nr:M48 family metalloprotease [Gemmatimonadota bacterium]